MLEEIRDALRKDKTLMAIMQDEDEMQQYRDDYYDEKEEDAKEKVRRVSSKSMALVASKTHDLLQAQVCSYCMYSLVYLITLSFSVTMHSYLQVQTRSVLSRDTTLRKTQQRVSLVLGLGMTSCVRRLE